MSARRHPHVVNVDEVSAVETQNGRFRSARRQLGAAAAAKALGCSVYEIPAGSVAFPFHFHCANEEALFVLEGRGTLRLGEERVPLRAGDFVAMPAGPEAPHQIVNDSEAPLRYLAVSTMVPTDITVYPDSQKIGLFAGAAPGGAKAQRYLDGYYRRASAVGYLEGEET